MQGTSDPVGMDTNSIVSSAIDTLSRYGTGLAQGSYGSINPGCVGCDPSPTDELPQRLGQITGNLAVLTISTDAVIGGGGGSLVALVTGQLEAEPITLAVTAAGLAGVVTSLNYSSKWANTPMQMSSNKESPSSGSGGKTAKDYDPRGRGKIESAEDAADQAKDLREAQKNVKNGKLNKRIDSTKKSDDREIQKAVEEWRSKNK